MREKIYLILHLQFLALIWNLNFNILAIIILFTSCGLKTDPKAKDPKEDKTIRQIYIDQYKENKDQKKKKKK